MNRETFGGQLKRLRENKNLSVSDLAKVSGVSRPFISGCQSGRRKMGEQSARKIAIALGLEAGQLEAFVLSAIDTCTEKVLNESRNYPASLINLIPTQLGNSGISPQELAGVQLNADGAKITLRDGRKLSLETTISYN